MWIFICTFPDATNLIRAESKEMHITVAMTLGEASPHLRVERLELLILQALHTSTCMLSEGIRYHFGYDRMEIPVHVIL